MSSDPSVSPAPSTLEPASDPERHATTHPALVALVAVAGATVLLANRADLPEGWRAARHAQVGWLLVLVVVTALGLVVLAGEHTAAQRAAGLRPRLSEVVPVALAAKFINSLAKSGGLAGLAVFRATAHRKGWPVAPVVAAYLLVAVLDVGAFAAILVAALVVVGATRRFTAVDAVATLVFTGYLTVVLAAIICAARSRQAVRHLYALPRNVLRRLKGGGQSSPHAVEPDHTAADELFDAITVLRRTPFAAGPAALGALAIDVVGVVQLWVALHALGAPASVTAAFVSYGLSTLLGIVGFTPGGLGFVELSLGAVLVSFGTALGVAAAAVVLYRIAEFWIPVAAGGLCLHWASAGRDRR